jgi:8-oxo-dGTP pyrophosphatase MutT (NUDIX family)
VSAWTVRGSRRVYDSSWVQVWLDDVELPDRRRLTHHALRFPRHSTSCVLTREDRMLLLWRHRHIPDAWGWEVPAGWSEPGEDPATAITREVEEETGWRPAGLTLMTRYNAVSGIGDMRFHVYHAGDARQVGEPADRHEADRIAWVPVPEVRRLLTDGAILDGPTLTAISYYLATT